MRKIAIAALLAVLVLSFAAVTVSASPGAPPILTNSAAVASNSVGFLNIPLGITATDSIIVFEWVGTVIPNACNSLSSPSDSFSNTWTVIGNCVADSNGAAMEAFSVASNSQTGSDSISCNFTNPNIYIESCYAFDISGPGAITLLASAIGTGSRISTNAVTASANSLIFQMAGIQFYCQGVYSSGSPTYGLYTFFPYIPSSSCNSGGGSITQYGMAGGYIPVGSGGLTTTNTLTDGQSGIVWSEIAIQVAAPNVTTTVTSYTATVIGMLVPDTTHLTNSLMLILAPLGGAVLCVLPFTYFQKQQEIGDKAIYPALFGLLVGAAVADLTVTSQSLSLIPFADIIVAGLLLFLWWWNS